MARNHGIILPEDLMVEILSWLPVKSLMRFKCVCKSWYAIITSPDFVSQHLNNYYNNCNNSCILLTITEEGIARNFSKFHFVPIAADEMLLNLPNPPFHVPSGKIVRIFGPCNGIFCVMFTGFYSKDVAYALWNLAIKEFRVLPPHSFRTSPDLPPTAVERYYSHGFGFDPVTNDYKLVLIEGFNEFENETGLFVGPYCPSQAVVYSLAADSWKHLEDLEIQLSFQVDDGTYTYLNGMCYWDTFFYKPQNVILSFDMAREVFQDIKGPDCLEGSHNSVPHLALYNDLIAFFVYKCNDERLDIWAMDGGYWINKISVGPLLGVSSAVGYWKDGQVILQSNTDSLLLCDTNTGEMMDLGFQEHVNLLLRGILIYKDSLVSIANGHRHVRYLAN